MAVSNGSAGLARGALLWFTGLLMVGCLVVLGTRLTVNESIRTTVMRVASENAGMAVEVGEVRGTWWSGLTLHHVKLHGTPDPASEVVADVPLIQVSYDLATFLGSRPRPIRLDIYHPDLNVKVRQDRSMNLQPRMRAVHDDPPFEPGPDIDLIVHGGHLNYADASARKPFVASVERLTGTGTLRGANLTLALQALQGTDVLRTDIRYNLRAMRGALDAQATGIDWGYWVNRFGWSPDFSVTGGQADLVLHAAWRDPLMQDELKLWGTATLNGGQVWLKNAAVPLEGLTGRIDFDQRAARFDGLNGRLAGLPLTFAGRVLDLVKPVPYLGYPDPTYALRVTAHAVNLAKLHIAWPGLSSLGLAGNGVLTADVTGRVSDPRVTLKGDVPVGRWGLESLTDVQLLGHYRPGLFELPVIRGRIAGGTLLGDARVDLPATGDLPYRVSLDFAGLKLPGLLDRYLTEPLMFPLDGRVHGVYTLAGAGARSRAHVAARLQGGTLDAKPVQAMTVDWTADSGKWTIPDFKLAWGKTRAEVAANGRTGGFFALQFKLLEGDLADLVALNPKPPETPIAGRVTGAGTLSGNFGKPLGWTGDVRFAFPTGTVWRETFDRGTLRGHFKDNRLVVDAAQARFLQGDVRASGNWGPLSAKSSVPSDSRFDVRLQNGELGALTALTPDWRALRGQVNGAFAYVSLGDTYEASGQVTAARIQHPGWGDMQAVRASVVMTPTEIACLPATWTQDGETVRASGTVTYPVTGEPVVDMRVRTSQADVAKLMGAVRWPAVMARLQPHLSRGANALGPLRPIESLPEDLPVSGDLPAAGSAAAGAAVDAARVDARAGDVHVPAPAELATHPLAQAIQASARGSSPLVRSLSDELARWQAYRKTPLNRVADNALSVPFWQELKGTLTLDARITGPLSQLTADVDVDAQKIRLLGRTLDEIRGRAIVSADRVRIELARVREAGRVVLTLAGALADSPADTLVVRAHGFDLGWLDRVLAPRRIQVTGRADGVVRLRGPHGAPRIEAEGAVRAGTFVAPGVQAIAFDALDADVAFERGRLWIDKATVRQGGREASVAGSLPVDARAQGPAAKLDLALQLADQNLAIVNLLAQDRFRWLGGAGTVAVQVHGTMAKPSLAGRIDLHEASFTAKGIEGPVTAFSADVSLDDEKVSIKALKGTYGGGGFEVSGDVFWEQFEPRRLDLAARARPFRIRTPDGTFTGMIEADMRLKGAIAAPVLSGQVSVWDGVVRIRDKVTREAAPAPLPFPVRLADVNITLGPSLYVRNALMDVSVTTLQRQGFLRVDGTLQNPSPRGVVIVESGTITPLNNAFKITEGRVDFLGENHARSDELSDILGAAAEGGAGTGLNGRLDVQARAGVYDYTENETVDVTAHVTGTLDRMEMRFSALPLRSEQQVLDILSKKQVLAGTFSGKLDRGEVIVKEVGGFVTSNLEELVSPLTLRLRNMMNLQTLRFELVSNYEKTSLSDLAGFRPALTLETRPLFERLSFGSRMVAGEFYDTSPNTGNDNTYASLNFRLNRRLAVEYRVDPYVSTTNQRIFNQTLGLRAQMAF